MEKKNKSKKSQYTQWIVASVILFAYFLFVLMNYSKQTGVDCSERVGTELSNHAKQVADSFESNIRVVDQAAHSAAGILALETDEDGYAIEVVKSAVDASPAYYGYYSDLKGNATDVEGNEFSVWDDRDYAKALMGADVISDMIPTKTGNDYTINFYVPVMGEEIVKGVVCLSYKASEFTRLVHASDNDGQTLYALMKKDGTIINMVGINRIREESNLHDLIADSNKPSNSFGSAGTGSALKKLNQNLENSKSGQQLCRVNGMERFICYQLVGTNEWYVIEMYSRDYFERLQIKYYRSTKKVIIEILVALSIFFGIIIFVNIFSRAIYNKKNEELQSKAETDLLTGLLNKIATEKHIQDFIDGDGHEVPGMLFVLDIDNFKKINDTMGHAFGDMVLSTLGIRLRNQFRISDIIGRIGGDEFIVYLKNINDEATVKREAERMVKFFKDFQVGDYVKYSATASIGVALYPQDGSGFDELYKAADKGVYLSKKRGKNQLAFYSETRTQDTAGNAE